MNKENGRKVIRLYFVVTTLLSVKPVFNSQEFAQISRFESSVLTPDILLFDRINEEICQELVVMLKGSIKENLKLRRIDKVWEKWREIGK